MTPNAECSQILRLDFEEPLINNWMFRSDVICLMVKSSSVKAETITVGITNEDSKLPYRIDVITDITELMICLSD